MEDTLYDVIILGGGPSGLTAAIYTSRAHLKTLVLAGNEPGGQLIWTTDVENYPGFPRGVLGPDLIKLMREQAERFGAEFHNVDATEISGSFEENFSITAFDGKKYLSRTVIVATGASAKWLDLPSEQKLRGRGVSACAVCDGYFFKDQTVAVVGGGDAAMEDAIFLTKYCPKVYVLVRKDKDALKASKIMQKRAFDNPKIEFIFNTEVKEVLGENKVEGLTILNNQTDQTATLDVTGLFIAIGHKPNTDFLKDYLEVDHMGYLAVDNYTESSEEGVFVGGDVSDYRYRQAVTAAGLGCMAALDTEKFLAEHGVEADV